MNSQETLQLEKHSKLQEQADEGIHCNENDLGWWLPLFMIFDQHIFLSKL